MRIPDRGSTTGDSTLDRPRAQRVGCPQGEQSESIPPSPPLFKMRACTKVRAFFFYIPRTRGDENPRPGFDNGRQHVGQTMSTASGLPAGRAKRVNPPRCTRRQRSRCLMAAAPYQAYAQISPLHHQTF